jgi:hypothetical protein
VDISRVVEEVKFILIPLGFHLILGLLLHLVEVVVAEMVSTTLVHRIRHRIQTHIGIQYLQGQPSQVFKTLVVVAVVVKYLLDLQA